MAPYLLPHNPFHSSLPPVTGSLCPQVFFGFSIYQILTYFDDTPSITHGAKQSTEQMTCKQKFVGILVSQNQKAS